LLVAVWNGRRTAYGALIDRHDAVLRLNQAPVGGYEQWVGRKTTFRLLNNKWTTVYYEDNVPNTNVPGGTSQLARFLINQEAANTTLVVARAPTKLFETVVTRTLALPPVPHFPPAPHLSERRVLRRWRSPPGASAVLCARRGAPSCWATLHTPARSSSPDGCRFAAVAS